MWCRKIERLGGQDVQQVRGGGERCSPVARGNASLEQKGANSVIDSANNPFSFTILRRGVGARHAEMDALAEKEGAGAGVIKLAPVVH